MEEVQPEFAEAQGAKRAFLCFSGDRQSCEAEIRRKKKSNVIKEVAGLKTIYKGNISLSRFLSECNQLDLHSTTAA